MNVTFITTVLHNPGDDFVRAGIIYLLQKKYGKFNIQLIHKHWPITVRNRFDWLHENRITTQIERIKYLNGYKVSKLLDLFPISKTSDKILSSDLLVQSGAPLYWSNKNNRSANIGWYHPLIIKRYLKIKDKIPLINIAAGSCQHYKSDGSEFLNDQSTLDFIKDFYEISNITTVRDKLIHDIFKKISLNVPLLPCTSIFAKDLLNILSNEKEYVVLNFMEFGGHYDFNENINKKLWSNTFNSIYEKINKENKTIIVCHSLSEVKSVKNLIPNAVLFYSRNWKDYLLVYSKAKFGIMNRVHGAMVLASFGIPSIIIGNDTRVQMGNLVGIVSFFVNEVTEEIILEAIKKMLVEEKDFSEKFNKIKIETLQKYMSLFEAI